MGLWFLSEKFNVFITGFNRVQRNGKDELWITEVNGSSRKVAEGQKAVELENHLLDMVWNGFPAIILQGDRIGTNVQPMEVEE